MIGAECAKPSLMKEVIATADAPVALGAYSQAVKVNDMIFLSGQLPISPKTNELISGSIAEQTVQVLTNIREILEEGGARMDDVVKVTIFLQDLSNFDEMNRAYQQFFPNSETSTNLLPARSTVQVARLPRDADLEIECIAVISRDYQTPELY